MEDLMRKFGIGSDERKKSLAADKGKKGGSCNVTHCQKPNSANYYNEPMRAWYCIACAEKIEAAANRNGDSFYPQLR